jgi:hypothetical protein
MIQLRPPSTGRGKIFRCANQFSFFSRFRARARRLWSLAALLGLGGGTLLPAAGVMAKDMADGSKAVGLFNTGTNGTVTVTVKWSDLKISGRQNVRDLWRQKNLGRFQDEFSLKVAPHSAELVKIAP